MGFLYLIYFNTVFLSKAVDVVSHFYGMVQDDFWYDLRIRDKGSLKPEFAALFDDKGILLGSHRPRMARIAGNHPGSGRQSSVSSASSLSEHERDNLWACGLSTCRILFVYYYCISVIVNFLLLSSQIGDVRNLENPILLLALRIGSSRQFFQNL